jgi:hypothetical protein
VKERTEPAEVDRTEPVARETEDALWLITLLTGRLTGTIWSYWHAENPVSFLSVARHRRTPFP